jgi:hypothetical protein
MHLFNFTNKKFVELKKNINHEYILHYRKHGRRKKEVVQVKIKCDVHKQTYLISERRKWNNTGIL